MDVTRRTLFSSRKNTVVNMGGYSARVELEMIVAGRKIELSQVAPEFVILQQPMELAPTLAEIVVRVDGHENRRLVRLVEGIQLSSRRVKVEKQAM